MHKKIIHLFVVLYLFSFTDSFGQAKKYYYNINAAEMAIVNGHLKTASEHYNKIGIKNLRFIDLFNYFIVSKNLRKYNLALKLTHELSNRGVDSTYFNQSAFNYIKSNDLNEIKINAKKEFEKRNNLYSSFKNQLDSLYNLDQSVFTYRTENKLFDSFPDSLAIINYNNMICFFELCDKYGFPSENNIGPKIFADTIFSEYNKYNVIAIHCLQMTKNENLKRKCIKKYKEYYEKCELSRGELQIINNLGDLDRSVNLHSNIITYNGTLYKLNNTPSIIDKSLTKYYYPSLKENEKKILYVYNNINRNEYFLYTIYDYIPDNSITERQREDMKNDYHIIYNIIK